MKKYSAAAALVSLMVIALVSLILVVAFSESSISTLEVQYNSQESERSYYLAESCLEEAITRLEMDVDFSSASLSFGSGRSCSISVSGTNPKLVDITTTVDELSEDYQASLDYSTSGTVNNFSLSSWGELP